MIEYGDEKTHSVPCPYCQNIVVATEKYLLTNDRLCCLHCNKAFDISLREEDNESESEYETGSVNTDGDDYW